ncbi:MAG: hypothetical protein K2G78_08765, partial [Muribaculaceae bacterium]|nr:hypothetical protein [Muribaculaceae bacterium]
PPAAPEEDQPDEEENLTPSGPVVVQGDLFDFDNMADDTASTDETDETAAPSGTPSSAHSEPTTT